MKTNRFETKDALILSAYYLVGVQLIIPVVIGFIVGITNALINGDVKFENYVLLQFLVFSIATLGAVLYAYNPLKTQLKTFIMNFKANIKTVFKNYLYSLLVMAIVTFLLEKLFNLGSSSNQIKVEELISQGALMMAMVTIIYAPLLEEIVFRGGLYLGLKDKSHLFATLLSSITFGAIHVIPQLLASTNKLEILFIIPYSILGYFMVKSTKDTKSIWGGISVHFINNLIATLAVIGAM